jgi:two-component system LytT family response regulator
VSRRKTIRVLIVDDELLARQRLEDLLRDCDDVEIVGTAENGDAAVEAIQNLQPDLVFLDVQMPGKTGVEVVRTIGPQRMPATVFVTAYDRYAVEAFDMAAVDYLVKPFDDERFEQAFSRARRLIELAEVDRLSGRLLAVLHVSGKTHVIRERMQTLEERLDPAKFLRIHRSAIVRLDQVDTLVRDPGGDYEVRLKSGAQLSVSRGRVEQLERWMGLAG